MLIITRTMLNGIFRDGHSLILTILLPVLLLIGLGIYMNDPTYTERLLTGVLTVQVLFGSGMVTAFNVMAQRNRGIYKLLRATPFRTSAFISAMTLARTIVTFLVSTVILITAIAFFNMDIGIVQLLKMAAVLIAGSVCVTAIGFFAANLSKDESNVNLISNLICFPMLFTSEAFYSMQTAPLWLQTFAKLQPIHYFVNAMSGAVAGTTEPAWSAYWLPLLILSGFAVLCIVYAALTFRWDSERSTVSWKFRFR